MTPNYIYNNTADVGVLALKQDKNRVGIHNIFILTGLLLCNKSFTLAASKHRLGQWASMIESDNEYYVYTFLFLQKRLTSLFFNLSDVYSWPLLGSDCVCFIFLYPMNCFLCYFQALLTF